MPRYIDAEALPLYDELFMNGVNKSGVWVRYRDVEKLIKNAPTADVEEVRHGKWLSAKYLDDCCKKYYHCSICNRLTEMPHNKTPYVFAPYCHCGAKMDGGET